ncbi:MAG: amino acid ABC transporter substrate-binding protein, partial [Bacteroidota bacterium]|nr:amino acid ABC transporter substrate-binding protein [Bacteroidota bacterium]
MTSVPSHLQLSNGNKWFLLLIIGFIIASCSPKVRPVAVQPVKKEAAKPVENKKPEPILVKTIAPKVSSISLILPFGLNHLAPGASYTTVSLKEADIALAYYRGFKLALDSLTAQGYNYKLLVYDSKDERAQAHSLANNPRIRSSDLIVGPVFPESMKSFTANYQGARQPIVSPLSPASPATFRHPGLV